MPDADDSSHTLVPSGLVALVCDGAGAATTLAALRAADADVVLARRWPACGGVAAPGGATTVDTPAAGDAGAINGALAHLLRERGADALVVFLGPGDVPGPGWADAHTGAHGGGPGGLALGRVEGDDAVAAWPGPAELPLRNLSARVGTLIGLGGLDERLRELDVALLDLVARARDAGVPVTALPDSCVRSGARTAQDARRLGRAVHALDVLGHAGLTSGSAARRTALRAIGRLAPVLRHRRAFASGHAEPLLALDRLERGGPTPVTPAAPRPPVAVIVPFAGTADAGAVLLERLGRLRRGPADEIVVVDNTRAGDGLPGAAAAGVRVLRADREWSSYHARNVGVLATEAPWLAFMDDDCEPSPGLLDAFFDPPPIAAEGALAGAIVSPPSARTAAERHADDAGVLLQSRSLSHPFRPYGVTANLLVRREALRSVGGFAEQVRSGGDVDVGWRLGAAGWAIGYRHRAVVVHHHRASWSGLMRQYRRYGAGIAWLARRHPGAPPRMALRPLVRLLSMDLAALRFATARTRAVQLATTLTAWRGSLDANRPSRPGPERDAPAATVLLAPRWPGANAVAAVIEAATRGDAGGDVWSHAPGAPDVAYAEDDGLLERTAALLALARTARGRAALRSAIGQRRAGLAALAADAAVARRLRARAPQRLEHVDGVSLRPADLAGIRPHAPAGNVTNGAAAPGRSPTASR